MREKKNNSRKKFDPITVKKTTVDFTEGLNDLISVCKDLADIIGSTEVCTNEIEARQKLVNNFAEHLPIFGDKETQFNTLSCTYNKVSYKFPTFCSIGWSTFVDRDTEETKYTFYYTIFSNKVKEENYDTLLRMGFEVLDK